MAVDLSIFDNIFPEGDGTIMNQMEAETNKARAKLEKALAKEYKQAEKEMRQKLDKHLKDFTAADAKKQALVKSGMLSPDDYAAWRKGQLTHSKWLSDMSDRFAAEQVKVNQRAAEIINKSLPDVYANGRNQGFCAASLAAKKDFSYTLFDRNTVEKLVKDKPDLLPKSKVNIPKDKAWNKRKMRSAVMQGMMQGESIPKIAKRLQGVTAMNGRTAIRNARTMVTSASNAGRLDSYLFARDELGLDLQKMWIATLDDRVRDSHAELDGETVPLDEPFSNGLMEPGDPKGEPGETYNCRCSMVVQLKGFERDASDLTLRNTDHFEYSSYDGWKAAHTKASAFIELSGIFEFDGKATVISDLALLSATEKESWEGAIGETKYNKITKKTEDDVAHYDPTSKNVNMFEFSSDNTFFHETAHAIDEDAIVGTIEFTGKRKKIGVDEWVSQEPHIDKINGASNAAEELYRLNPNAWDDDNAAFMKWAGMKDDDDLTALFGSIRKFEEKYGEDAASALSDMIDAHTLGKYPMSLICGGHGEEYWVRDANNAPAEAWAEISSLRAQSKGKAIKKMAEILPNRVKATETIYDIVFGGKKSYEYKIIDEKRTRVSETIWRFRKRV